MSPVGKVVFKRLSEIDPAVLIAQMNDPVVRQNMPLAGDPFDTRAMADWVAGKEKQWQANGLGPWAFEIDGVYAGWGGFQREGDDWDLGLVLVPAYFGAGLRLVRMLLDFARNDARIPSVTLLLPPNRRSLRPLQRLGALQEGEIDHDGHIFLKFRVMTPGGSSLKSVHVIVSGRVQGIGYRAWMAEEASLLGLSGWVRNRRDGTVEAVLRGANDAVDDLVVRLHNGPIGARVDHVFNAEWDGPVPEGFSVLSTE